MSGVQTHREPLFTSATATAPVWQVRVQYDGGTMTERVRATSPSGAIAALAGFLALAPAAFTSAEATPVGASL